MNIFPLGHIVRVTSEEGETLYGIVVDYHPNTELCGVRWDDNTCLVTLWSKIGEDLPGTKSELLPPDTPVKWQNPQLYVRINSSEIDALIQESQQRLDAETRMRQCVTLQQWLNPPTNS